MSKEGNEASWGSPNEVNVDDSKEIFRRLSRQFSKEQQDSKQSSKQSSDQQRKSVSDATVKGDEDEFDLQAFITVCNHLAYKSPALTHHSRALESVSRMLVKPTSHILVSPGGI